VHQDLCSRKYQIKSRVFKIIQSADKFHKSSGKVKRLKNERKLKNKEDICISL
jgi:hypothetical protein